MGLAVVTAADRAAATLRGGVRESGLGVVVFRRATGNKLVRFCGLARPCECGQSPLGLVVVTAADRAAATLRGWGVRESGLGVVVFFWEI